MFDWVAWAEKEDTSAVILSGTKGLGEYYVDATDPGLKEAINALQVVF